MSDYERIYLQPKCCADPDVGRLWCQDDEPETCPEGGKWTPYVLASEYDRLQSEVERLRVRCGELEDALVWALGKLSMEVPVSGRNISYIRAFGKAEATLSGDGKGWLLRKQAEAVEALARRLKEAADKADEGADESDTACTLLIAKSVALKEAQRLRQQADEAEKAGGGDA